MTWAKRLAIQIHSCEKALIEGVSITTGDLDKKLTYPSDKTMTESLRWEKDHSKIILHCCNCKARCNAGGQYKQACKGENLQHIDETLEAERKKYRQDQMKREPYERTVWRLPS